MSVQLLDEYNQLNAYFIDTGLVKSAQISPSSIADGVKGFVAQHMKEDKTSSLLTFIAPAGVSMLFEYLGLPKIGMLLGLLTSMFHINPTQMFSQISSALSGLVSSGGGATSEAVRSKVNEVINKLMPDKEKTAFYTPVNDSVRILKLAELQSLAVGGMSHGFGGSLLSAHTALSYAGYAAVKSIASKLFGWLYPLLFGACGFLVAGDAVNALLGRPNAFQKTLRDTSKDKKDPESPEVTPTAKESKPIVSAPKGNFPNLKQNKYYSPENYSSSKTWAEAYPVNQTSVENMLLDFTDEVYDGLKPFENFITSSRAFKQVTKTILDYNSVGDKMTFIPRGLTSKKQIVDLFLRDLNNYLDANPQLKTAQITAFSKNNGDL